MECRRLQWVVVLNYNVADHCIRQLDGLSAPSSQGIFVVDNASDAKDYAVLEAACRSRGALVLGDDTRSGDHEATVRKHIEAGGALILVRNADNLGYSGGNNTALRLLHRVLGDEAQFLVINPDLIITKDAAVALLECPADLAGPAIFEHFMQSINTLCHAMDFTTGFVNERLRKPGRAVMLHGCCLKMSGGALSRYGYLPDENFLYEEELKYFERVSRLGGDPVYLPHVRVEHIGKASTKKLSYGYFYYIFRNKLCYFLEIARPNYHRSGAFAFLYLQWCVQALQPQIQRRNWDGVKGLLHGVWHGLQRYKGRLDKVFRDSPA